MANIDPAPSWADIRQLETTDRNLAGLGGVLNTQPVSIAARLNLLRDNATALNNTVAGVSSRQDSADSAIASLESQVLDAPGTLSDLDHGAPISVTGDQFPDVLSIDNSRGPVLALNESISDLAQRDEWLRDNSALVFETTVEMAATAGYNNKAICFVRGLNGGEFYWDSIDSSVSDGFITFGANTQGRWIRKTSGVLRLNWFGSVAGSDISNALNAAAIASARYSISTIIIPQPSSPSYYLLSGNVIIDINANGGISIVGEGTFRRRVRIYHYGNNIGIWIRKNFQTASDFWASGAVIGLDFQGCSSASTLATPNPGTSAQALRISDTWGFTLQEMDIRNYSELGGISLYNWSAWTEGTVIKNVMIRQCRRGITFGRNLAVGSTATDSFFRSRIEFEFNAGLTATQCVAMDIGDGTGRCLVYGSEVSVTFWASAGGGHQCIRVRPASLLVDSDVNVWSDGLAYAEGATSEVMQQVRVDSGAIYQSRTKVGSQQGGAKPLKDINIVRRSTLWYDLTRLAAMSQGKPEAYAPGINMYFEQAYTSAERVSDIIHTLDQIPLGTVLRITMRTRFSGATGATGNPTTEVYTVSFGDGNITAAVSSILINRVNQFSTVPTAPSNRLREGGQLLVPYLRNKNANNNIAFSASGGNSIDFVIPAAPIETPTMTVGVQIEYI